MAKLTDFGWSAAFAVHLPNHNNKQFSLLRSYKYAWCSSQLSTLSPAVSEMKSGTKLVFGLQEFSYSRAIISVGPISPLYVYISRSFLPSVPTFSPNVHICSVILTTFNFEQPNSTGQLIKRDEFWEGADDLYPRCGWCGASAELPPLSVGSVCYKHHTPEGTLAGWSSRRLRPWSHRWTVEVPFLWRMASATSDLRLPSQLTPVSVYTAW